MKYELTFVTGPSIKRETTTNQVIGIDWSLKESFISVRQGDQQIWRGKCPSDPKLIAEVIRKRAPTAERVVFETARVFDPAVLTTASLAQNTHGSVRNFVCGVAVEHQAAMARTKRSPNMTAN